MKIRLDQVTEPFEWRETLSLTAAEVDRSEVVDLGEIACRGRISQTIEGLLLRLSLTYEQSLRCTRCLEPVTTPAASDLDLLIHVGAEGAVAEERALELQDFGVLFLDAPELDTRPILLEQVQLGFPMKPLCREDCAGLCVSCGADLNQGPCRCEKVADPRWGALAALKRGGAD